MASDSERDTKNGEMEEDGINYNLLRGRYLSSPQPGEEVVIAGISGVFPYSMNVHEFRDHLFNKDNMVQPNRRWRFKHPEIPAASGTIPDVRKYDAGFFGIHDRQAESLDTMTRLIHERAIEAIFDAGLHPSDLQEKRTGVYVGACFSESEKCWFFDNVSLDSFAFTGVQRSMLAHRLSYFLKLKGPAFCADTACSSSLYALEHAFRALRYGEIDIAIVGGVNLCFHPFVSLQFARLGVLSLDGNCKTFDASGNGYARSEAASVVILQRAKDAHRFYAQIVHAKTSCDGYKEQGITYPSGLAQQTLLKEFYEECGVKTTDLSYLEAHGTGTFVGDPEECNAIDQVLTKGRKTPLLIGSVKSNIGHSEPASGLCSIAKCIIGLETGFIPPNLHYNSPRPEIVSLVEGRMKVVTEKMPFPDHRGLLGINSFGFGGGNCHILLKKNEKEKKIPVDDLPRLVCVSGRTEEAVTTILDELRDEAYDIEHIRLLHEVFRKNINNHLYRGYNIVSKSGEMCRYVQPFGGSSTKLYIAFGDLKNWYDIGKELMVLPVFADSIYSVQQILTSKDVNIINAIENETPERQINHLIGSVAVQIGIIDILKQLEIKPSAQFGFSFGELTSAYFDGVLTLTETVSCAYMINQSLNDIDDLYNSNTNMVNGHNTDSIINNIPATPKSDSIIAIRKKLQQSLSMILAKPKQWNRSQHHMPSSAASAEYFCRALTTNFQAGSVQRIPKNSILLKVGTIPNNMKMEAKIKTIPIIPTQTQNAMLSEFMKTVGNLYINGHSPQLANLYPIIQFPVSRGTRMISPYIKWKHERDWFIPEQHLEAQTQAQVGARVINVQLSDHEWTFVDGHVIDGRNLFPATGYLYVVWETLSVIHELPMSVMSIVFENVRFMRATTVPKKGCMVLNVTIQKQTGHFEVVESDTPVVKGTIHINNADQLAETSWRFDDYIQNDMVLKAKDIYKELRLRGYNYTKGFRSIENCNLEASHAYIKWEDNWVTFMDNMLQMKILQTDTRFLYVPTYIERLTIPAKTHLRWINTSYINKGIKPILPVLNSKESGIIRCGELCIVGLLASSIPRRKDMGIPVVEKYEFIPNITDKLTTEESVRINMQLILENALVYKVKGVEVIDEFSPKDDTQTALSQHVVTVLADQPLIQPSMKILSTTPIEECPVPVEDKKLNSELDCLLVIASGLLSRPDVFNTALKSLKDNGFLLTREPITFDPASYADPKVNIFTVHKTDKETLVLLRKNSRAKQMNTVKISNSTEFRWVQNVQEVIKMKPNEDIVLYAENEPESGILGLTNCLRREPESTNVRCVHLVDDNLRFDTNNQMLSQQLQKNMAINVYRNGTWGTMRHLLMKDLDNVESEHCFANITTRGDLSSLRWIEGPLHHGIVVPEEGRLIYVYYTALNFRDVMTASGRISADVINRDRTQQDCVQGFEYAGKDAEGNRYAGIVTHGALTTMVLADAYLCMKVPDSMTLEEAATIPVVYITVLYALHKRGQMRKGESILIHSGTGGIGQAAIAIALYYDCNVFTTVGNQDKKEYLMKQFPQLKASHIGNSRDTSFEQMVHRETGGRGVDLVLNSLAEEKLIASIRCLSRGGRFLEIGKFDLASNNEASLLLLRNDCSFHGIMLDQFFIDCPKAKIELAKILNEAIAAGAVKPLQRTVFKYHEVEKAFRFMASGKHMGKVVVKVRDQEQGPNAPPGIKKFVGIPRYFCQPEKAYIIVGGLGGFGLELADWLVLRGARKIVLTSRKGESTGYQMSRIRIWRSYGSNIMISKADITTKSGCKELLESAQELGDVEAIFNLAVVLADSVFENQSADTFRTSFGPKAVATEYLDELSRTICPNLKDFVIFSSVTCGRGNAGQSNYGMANSVMERICERRKREGYPAMAIQWGAIGEVGLVADMQEDHRELEISGTLQQRLPSCFEVLNRLMRYKECPIVSSMVVAEKRGGAAAAENVVDAVINILGLNDSKSVSLHATLAELGMDSITAVEIKQTLEREYDVFLSAKDIRSMTLAKLKAIQEESTEGLVGKEQTTFGIQMVFRIVGDENDFGITHMKLNTKVDVNTKTGTPQVLMIPGIEGFASVFQQLALNLEADATSLQFDQDKTFDSIKEIAESLLPLVKENLPPSTEPFNIIAYSYGCLVGLELVHLLEKEGYTGNLVCIDGAPKFMTESMKTLGVETKEAFETGLICHLMSFYVPQEDILKHQESLYKCNSWEDRVNMAMEVSRARVPLKSESQRRLANGIYSRVNLLRDYQPTISKIASQVKLFKPTIASIPGLSEDYDLSNLCGKQIEVTTLDGNHATILDNEELIKALNAIITSK